jgi:hypothetical protein
MIRAPLFFVTGIGNQPVNLKPVNEEKACVSTKQQKLGGSPIHQIISVRHVSLDAFVLIVRLIQGHMPVPLRPMD